MCFPSPISELRTSTDARSFRYSSCGLPVLNLDVGYSAFLASGPAVDVIAKIIGMPAPRGGGRGGYTGGIQPRRELTEMNERDIARAKSKLRGAKVMQLRFPLGDELMDSSQ